MQKELRSYFPRSLPNLDCVPCSVLNGLGVKDSVMSLLNDGDTEMKQQALLTLSKLMVSKWQFMNADSSSGTSPRRQVSGSQL